MEAVSIVLATLALAVSVVTAWLTLLRRGTLRMTQPAMIALGTDRGGIQKTWLRMLLYSTGKRGQLVENMFLKVRHGESVQNLNLWVCGETVDELLRGSGLFVPENGVALFHHFLPPPETKFEFFPGEYRFETYASVVGRGNPLLLNSVDLRLSAEEAAAIKAGDGVYFDWGPDSRKYHPRVEKKPEPRIPGLR